MKQTIRCGMLYLILFVQILAAQDVQLLKKQDVKTIMSQILADHLDSKKVNAEVFRNALKNYFDHFDPERIYLLEGETAAFVKMPDAQIQELVLKYKNNDYSVFEKINAVIQRAIIRGRGVRQSMLTAKPQLFQTALNMLGNPGESMERDQKKPYPKNRAELENRIRANYIDFIQGEKRRYGEAYVRKNQVALTKIYQRQLEDLERAYLYLDATGKPLSAEQKENVSTLHVLKALASGLDAHTEFFTPTEAYDLRINLQKSYEGIGVLLKASLEGVVVSGIVEGSPAAKNGKIQINDRLISINGTAVRGDDVEQAISLLKGEDAKSVNLVLARGSEEIRLTLQRASITVDEDRVDVTHETFGNGIIGTITLHSFYQGNGISSEKDVQDAIQKLEKIGNLRGIVLDLRENTGGYLSQAVKVAGLFMTNGVVVISKYSSGEKHYFRDMDGKAAYTGPLVILTSKMTASAAEIVAQALQDYGVAIIVGDEHTYGKGTIQTQTVTQDGGNASFFKVTVGKYYTVSGKTPQLSGVRADVVVPGKYLYEKIGEGYLSSTIKADKIPESYIDPLADIDPAMKPWFMRYYIPTEQKKNQVWTGLIPRLQANSSYRISHNKDYQLFLRKLKGGPPLLEQDSEAAAREKKRGIGKEDVQMVEALNVLRDMIYLHTHSRASLDPAESIADTK